MTSLATQIGGEIGNPHRPTSENELSFPTKCTHHFINHTIVIVIRNMKKITTFTFHHTIPTKLETLVYDLVKQIGNWTLLNACLNTRIKQKAN